MKQKDNSKTKDCLLVVLAVAFVMVCIIFAIYVTTNEPGDTVAEETSATEPLSESAESEPASEGEQTISLEQQELIDETNEQISEGYEVYAEINGIRYEHAPGYEIVITEDTVTRFDVVIDHGNKTILLRMKPEYLEENMTQE